MPLNHIHITRTQTPSSQSLQNHTLLSKTTRRSQTIARTILIDRTATHHRQHPTPITHSIRNTLQHHQTNTLTPTSPIRPRRKRLTPPIHSQTTLTRKLNEHPRSGQHGDAPGKRKVTLAAPQRTARQVHGHQR
jgi:hypothetical protein